MNALPEVADVVAVAESLGIHLSAEEAVLYRDRLVEQLADLDAFLRADIDEGAAPRFEGRRDAGHRPSPDEDPYNAWMWRCEIPGAAAGPLAGKTVSFKDHVAVAGIPLTFGARMMEGFVPDVDATIVTRVLEAGGTVTGKNAMNGLSGGFAMGGGIGDFARPLNPHDADRVSGGSSSGSAVAVVAGEVDISFGGDQGGSVRVPAAWSGCVGLKPTFGLVSHFGVGFGAEPSLDHVGPLTRTVEDAAAALQAVAGFDGLDPRQGRQVPERIDVLRGLADGVRGLRIAVLDEGFAGVDPEIAEVVTAAVDVLEAAGAVVARVSVPEHLTVGQAALALEPEGGLALLHAGYLGAFAATLYPSSIVAAVNRAYDTGMDLLSPSRKLGYLVGELSRRTFHGRVYAKAHNVRPTFVRAYDAALAGADVLVMPTCPTTAPASERPATHLEAVADGLGRGRGQAARNTRPFNYTGHPALAVPCGKAGGLPVSMQLVGRAFDDGLLLRVAYAYQQSVDWAGIISVDP